MSECQDPPWERAKLGERVGTKWVHHQGDRGKYLKLSHRDQIKKCVRMSRWPEQIMGGRELFFAKFPDRNGDGAEQGNRGHDYSQANFSKCDLFP